MSLDKESGWFIFEEDELVKEYDTENIAQENYNYVSGELPNIKSHVRTFSSDQECTALPYISYTSTKHVTISIKEDIKLLDTIEDIKPDCLNMLLNSTEHITININSEYIIKEENEKTYEDTDSVSKAIWNEDIFFKNSEDKNVVCKTKMETFVDHNLKPIKENVTDETEIIAKLDLVDSENQNKLTNRFKFRCNFCLYKSNCKRNIKYHVNAIHTREILYKCQFCEFKSAQERQLKKHERLRHMKNLLQKCEQCEYVTGNSTLLKKHKAKHKKTFHQCLKCKFKSSFKSNLEQHINAVHTREKMYECFHCDYKATRKTYLEYHLNARHGKKTYKCDQCNYITNVNRYFKNHIRFHNDRSQKKDVHRCQFCDYETAVKGSLTIHLNVKHMPKNVYSCKFCDYATPVRGNLKVHENKHTKKVIYKCKICQYGSIFKCNLKTHEEKKHIRKDSYKCHLCVYECRSKPTLSKHLNFFHKK